MRFDDLFGQLAPILGAVALPPLPGAAGFGGDFGGIVRRALADARGWVQAGCDGLLVENRGDGPFTHDLAPPATIAAMAVVVRAIGDAFPGPLGVTLLRNDAPGAVAIAAVTDAAFVRVPLHAGHRITPTGLMEGRHSETIRQRRLLGADVALLADLDWRPDQPPDELRRHVEALYFEGLADAIVVPDPAVLEAVRAIAPEAVLLAAGVRPGQARGLLEHVRGVILDTAARADDDPLGPVDPARAAALVARLRST